MGASIMELMKTPVGKFRWFKCLGNARKAYDAGKPDEWTLDFLLDSSDPSTQKWIDSMETKFGELFGTAAKKSPYWFNCNPDDKEDGFYKIKFKKTCWVNDNGVKTEPANVIDSKLQKWPIDKEIGNGSKGRIAYKINTWSKNGASGMTLDPMKIMIMDYVPYEGGSIPSDDEVFGVVEGGFSLEQEAEKAF